MRVLLINKFHYLQGGAERAYFDTAEILAQKGHQVAFFAMRHPRNRECQWSDFFVDQVDTDDAGLNIIQKATAALKILHNRQSMRNLSRLIGEFRPDIAHLHNIYHQLSPTVVTALNRARVPMVMTLHDYKVICPNYNMFVRGQIWEKTRGGRYYHCLLDRCVKDSYLKSLVCTLEAYINHICRYYNRIDTFLSPSRFLIAKAAEHGFRNNIQYLPNPLLKSLKLVDADTGSTPATESSYILYFGRLSHEKGIAELIEAYAQLDTPLALNIVGDGPQRYALQQRSDQLGLKDKVAFLGYQSGSDLWRLVAGAYFIVVPSRWYENAPYSVIEAMSLAKTVVTAKIGGLAEMVTHGTDGLLYRSDSRSDLTRQMQRLIDDPTFCRRLGERARERVSVKNSKSNYYRKLIEIYRTLVKRARR